MKLWSFQLDIVHCQYVCGGGSEAGRKGEGEGGGKGKREKMYKSYCGNKCYDVVLEIITPEFLHIFCHLASSWHKRSYFLSPKFPHMDIIFLISQSLRARWNNIFESIGYTERIQMSVSILWIIKSDLLLPE